MTRAAFFDFDGTLLTAESGRICAVPAIRAGLIGPALGLRLVGTYLASKLGVVTREAAQRVGFLTYRGWSLVDLRVEMQKLHDTYLRPHLSAPVAERRSPISRASARQRSSRSLASAKRPRE